jgi:hypothetical protein
VETGPRQFVRQRLDRHHGIRPGFLALVETLGLGTETQRKVGRFDKGPGQILVAILGIALALRASCKILRSSGIIFV